jgi:hypothetical protein
MVSRHVTVLNASADILRIDRGIAALAHYPRKIPLLGHSQQRQAVFEWF